MGVVTLFLFFVLLSSVRAGDPVLIDPNRSWGQWEGWGTSLCWWGKVFGDRDDLADAFFTLRDPVTVEGHALPGLGLTFARYNLGACGEGEVDGHKMVVSPHIPGYRQIDAYWLDGRSADPQSKSWNWSADANQRAMLLKARDRGVNRFELFSNSPPWWMCANRNPSGAATPRVDNLPPDNYEKFAVYLATFAREAATRWGITFTSVEPFNEPSANWWTADKKQEGCYFSPGAQAAVVPLLRAQLDRLGLRGIRVSASDENTYDAALAVWRKFSPSVRDMVGQVNVHGYQKSKGARAELFQAASGKRLWNTEYGENDPTGLELASNLHLDLHLLHPTVWTYWQPLDGGGWGLLRTEMTAKRIEAVNPKYHVLAQYTRHIRPGMTILDTGETDTVAAYDASARRLVIVTLSRAAPGKKTFDLSKFARADGPVTGWLTAPRAAARHETHPGLPFANKRLDADLPADAVETFEIENVTLR